MVERSKNPLKIWKNPQIRVPNRRIFRSEKISYAFSWSDTPLGRRKKDRAAGAARQKGHCKVAADKKPTLLRNITCHRLQVVEVLNLPCLYSTTLNLSLKESREPSFEKEGGSLLTQ